jgi:aldehyde:ferredoxin oxidoreductase
MMAMDQLGYMGKFLRVNLGNGKITLETPGESHYKRYLGGRGMIIHSLLTEVPPHADPFGTENKLVFASGLLTGHKLVGTGRSSVGSKSPLTGGCGESEAGGLFGTELRKAGYDVIIVEGVSKKPVYLWIHDGTVEIRNAAKIWGSEVRPAMEWFEKDVGEKRYRTALIGPGGENRVHYANIIVDCRSAFGRSGMGAVMGSKRLKGVVVKGSKLPSPIDKEAILALNRIMKGKYKTSPFEKYGTGAAMNAFEAAGNLPIRNYAGGHFPNVEKIDAVTLLREYGVGMEGCFNCPIKCKKRVSFKDSLGDIDGSYGGAEYETLASFGSNLLIDDLNAVSKAHEICNSHGIDTISTGATIAFAMECFENGILTPDDVDGLQLNFGNPEAMLEMVRKIALRQGIGDLLAKGSKKAAEEIGKGSIKFAMQVKGLELPYHEPRLNQGLALHYSIHGIGADHVSGVIDGRLVAMMDNWDSLNLNELIPSTELSPRKARMAYELGLWRQMPNYLGLCSFLPWSFMEIRDAVAAVTGWRVTSWKLMKAVERGITLMRIFNLREGFTRDDDRLPDRFYTSPKEGPLEGVKIDPNTLRKMQEIYYEMMGWDKNGVPTEGCLVALDLEWAIPYIKRE